MTDNTLCVLTAGPSAGKTSTIRELSARGYTSNPEGARIVIDQAISEGRDIDVYRPSAAFRHDVIDKDRELEVQAMHEFGTVIMDRSLADNIAYHRVLGGPSYDLWDECSNRYDHVFLLEQIDYEDDYARNETAEESRRVHEELRNVYEELGYDVIDVPLMPVDERADLIENVIE